MKRPNFDYTISRDQAEKILRGEDRPPINDSFAVMAKDKDDINWEEVTADDLKNGKLHHSFSEFGIWFLTNDEFIPIQVIALNDYYTAS